MKYLLMLGLLLLGSSSLSAQESDLELTILHTSETHAHHLPQEDHIGGVARQAAIIEMIRAEKQNTLLLDVGGRFTGTLFHEVWRGGDNSQVMNALGYDAMVLGKSEFDEDDRVLGQFLGALTFPVIGSNLDAANSPDLAGKLVRMATLERGGQNIGLIGISPVLQTDTAMLFQDDYLNRIQDAVNGFQERGVQIILLLSALDFQTNLALAPQLAGVDILIGGGDATLLSELYANSAAEYPLLIENDEPLLIVQAGADNRFLGRLDLVFASDGTLKTWAGEPILLSEYLPDSPEMQVILADLQSPIPNYLNTQLRDENGDYINLENPLRHGECSDSECFLGSLLADAMRETSQSDIALLNAGVFAGDFNAGRITNQQIADFLVGDPHWLRLELSGLDLALWIEQSISALGTGDFLQVSGLRLRYDAAQPSGARLISLEVGDETFEAIDLESQYTVTIADSMLASYPFGGEVEEGAALRELWVAYLQTHNPPPFLFKERIIRRN